jgi:hypothetical protein
MSIVPSGGPRLVKRKQPLWRYRGFAELDGRSNEAREEKRLIRELTAHVGNPTAVQRILIKRSARLLIMIMQLEVRMIEGNKLGDLGGRQVVALHNALRLSLSALGMEKGEQTPRTLTAYLGDKAA